MSFYSLSWTDHPRITRASALTVACPCCADADALVALEPCTLLFAALDTSTVWCVPQAALANAMSRSLEALYFTPPARSPLCRVN